MVVDLLYEVEISKTQDIHYSGDCCMGSTKLFFKTTMPLKLSVALNDCVMYVGVLELCGKDLCVIGNSA